jgi:hypothetical protein
VYNYEEDLERYNKEDYINNEDTKTKEDLFLENA